MKQLHEVQEDRRSAIESSEDGRQNCHLRAKPRKERRHVQRVVAAR